MNNNKYLIHYLNSGVQIKWDIDKYYPLVISNNTVSIRAGIPLDAVIQEGLKPLLYPLSCLTETIIHNGVEEIPLVELAKIAKILSNDNISKKTMYDTKKSSVLDYNLINSDSNFQFVYDKIKMCFWGYNYFYQSHTVINYQLVLFDYLYSRRINIWNIDAIDPRELGDKNPYLLTDKTN